MLTLTLITNDIDELNDQEDVPVDNKTGQQPSFIRSCPPDFSSCLPDRR